MKVFLDRVNSWLGILVAVSTLVTLTFGAMVYVLALRIDERFVNEQELEEKLKLYTPLSSLVAVTHQQQLDRIQMESHTKAGVHMPDTKKFEIFVPKQEFLDYKKAWTELINTKDHHHRESYDRIIKELDKLQSAVERLR